MRLMPILQALNPRLTPIDWGSLQSILKDLVDLFRDLKVEKDIYAPVFLTKGSQRTYQFETVRGNQGSGDIFFCTFPGLTRRYWDVERQGWYEALVTQATVELESALLM